MRTNRLLVAALLYILALLAGTSRAEAPKRLLVVTTTTGFRHSSIPTGEKVLAQLAEQSHAFTIDLLEQPPGKPESPKKPKELKPDATPEQKEAFKAAQEKYKADYEAFQVAAKLWDKTLSEALLKMNPQSLKDYDGVVFENTTGDLPLPDKDGFLEWVKAGHAFIAMHSGSDTLHGWPAYHELLGGEFAGHKAQVGADLINVDPKHPANVKLPAVWPIQQEELYRFKNYDPAKVHELLFMDKDPNEKTVAGHFPVSWCHEYGKGKVFYTSLGHREDIWDADPKLKDRKNSVEISLAYQAHILGGIKWALGLEPGDATPGNSPAQAPTGN